MKVREVSWLSSGPKKAPYRAPLVSTMQWAAVSSRWGETTVAVQLAAMSLEIKAMSSTMDGSPVSTAPATMGRVMGSTVASSAGTQPPMNAAAATTRPVLRFCIFASSCRFGGGGAGVRAVAVPVDLVARAASLEGADEPQRRCAVAGRGGA